MKRGEGVTRAGVACRAQLGEAKNLTLTAQHRASDEYVDRLDWLERDLIARDLEAALKLIGEARRLLDRGA